MAASRPSALSPCEARQKTSSFNAPDKKWVVAATSLDTD